MEHLLIYNTIVIGSDWEGICTKTLKEIATVKTAEKFNSNALPFPIPKTVLSKT